MPQADLSLPVAWHTEADRQAGPDRRWWEQYGSPELNELIEQARAENLDIASAASRLQQADAQLRQSGAALLPQLSGGLNASRSDSARTDADGGSSRNLYGANLSAAYEVDFWGRNRAGVDSAQAGLQATRFDRDTVVLSTDAAVANAWFQLLENRERLELGRRSLEIAERVLELVEARYRFGAADALELSQQRTLVAQLRAAMPGLEQAAVQLNNALTLLLGAAPDAPLPDGRLAAIRTPAVDAVLPAELLTRRPDIAASEARLLAANADLTAARAALLPGFQLTGQYNLQSLAFPSLFGDPASAWSLAAGLTQPIFQGGRLRAQVALSEARQQELLLDYRRSILSALAETDNALATARHSAIRHELLEQASQEAELAFRLAEARYRAGAITLQTLLDTQRTWYQSQDALVQQRSAQLQASVGLYRALGGGWDAAGVSY